MSTDAPPAGGGALERLLLDAAGDPALRQRLRQNPLTAAEEHGARLGPTERAMLEAMTPADMNAILSAMANRDGRLSDASEAPAPVVMTKGSRRGRVTVAAVAAVAVIGGGAFVLSVSAGSRPDRRPTTAPQSTPDANAPDGGTDAGRDSEVDIQPAKPTGRAPK